MVPDLAGNDSRVDSKPPCKVFNRVWRSQVPCRTGLPFTIRNQHFASQIICLLLLRVGKVVNVEIVVESGRIDTQMLDDMDQFMHQNKPEIVESVMSYRKTNGWTVWFNKNCSTVQECFR